MRFRVFRNNRNNISLVVYYNEDKVIAKFSTVYIDWEKKHITNMGIRLHPDYCNKGYGTQQLKDISNWYFNQGIIKIQFDVLNTNNCAIKCYKNAGYKITGEFYHENDKFLWMESS
ncbi:GNAT family N-acetyltransferase [Sporosalibacterium faouarense]|uniref:GNAT family N-acetyltransferase n=1 Tax=Sporosalibacterium faouarense TaxID=516123 RepID=UPI00192CD3BA|nr:GNAT family N-acetyltransferase [Sporosalibacterium faouarense]